MISIRKTWWAGLALAAFVGCNTEEPAATSVPEPTTNVPAPSSPPGPPPAASTPAKESKPEAAPKVEPPPASPPAIEQPTPKPDEKKPEAKKADEKKAENTKLTDEQVAEINKLPAADKELALKQMICPVSDEPLGEMGAPLKVTADGKTFFLCCKSCEKEVKKDAKAVLAKLKN